MWKTILKYLIKWAFELAKKVLPAIEELVMEEVQKLLEESLAFIAGDTFTEAKTKLINEAFERINLPLVLKPFKGLIKKALLKKLDEALEKTLQDLHDKVIEQQQK